MLKSTNTVRLTPYQSIFYYEWLHDPLRSDYNIVIDITMCGKINIDRCDDGIVKIANECFLLNCNVENRDSGLFWKHRDDVTHIISYYGNTLSDKEIYQLVSKPFDLEKDLLVRCFAIDLGNSSFRILFVFPHILVDGISTLELVEKWRNNYNQVEYEVLLLEEQIKRHEDLSLYFDEILNQNREKMSNFWYKHLDGITGVDLSFLKNKNKAKPASFYRLVSEYTFGYDKAVYTQIKSLGRRFQITPYLFGQTVLAILLHKITGQDELALAYPVALLEGREMMYGAHVNTLLIDYRFNKETTIYSLLCCIQEYYRDLKKTKARYLPVHEMIHNADNSGVLDVVFAQTFLRDHVLGLDGVEKESVNHEFQIDLTCALLFEQEEHNGCLNYRIRYDKDVLDEDLVYRFLVLYKRVFDEFLSDLLANRVERKISDIRLLDDKEWNTLIYDWNFDPDLGLPDKTVVRCFEERVEQIPDYPAIVYKDNKFSFRELNEMANTLAAFLKQDYGIETGDLVALYLDKSEWMPVAILAILKAGGAYVPMDTEAPTGRIAYMIKDTQAKVVLTNRVYEDRLANLLNPLGTAIILCDAPDFQAKIRSTYSSSNLGIDIRPNDLAYVIYTSGTTGEPKGVMLEHGGLFNTALNLSRGFGLATKNETISPKNCLWYANYVFDAHIPEFFTAIMNGHCVYVLEEEKRVDFHALRQYITDHQIDIATIPPAILGKDQLLELPTLVVAGDVTGLEILTNYISRGTVVINAYGPTEITVCATFHSFQNGDSPTNIGRPVRHVTSYILNADMQPVPVGALGELFIGGAGVGREYLNNPGLTKEKFIANPFQTEREKQLGVNSILYKSGDLVRYLPDGDIEYVGRNDFQVKIRGFRIELGEIENCLSHYPGVNQSVVLVRELANGTKYLAGYYVSENELSATRIKEHLALHLPSYMIPSVWVHLTSLPITVNGKLDRKALPEPEWINQTEYVAPENDVERFLCRICADILGLNESVIGSGDDFLSLGGDSISGIQLVSRIRRQFLVQFSIKDIFTLRTIKALSDKIAASASADQMEIRTEEGLLVGESGLLPIQRWFFDRVDQGIFSRYNHWNQTFMLSVPLLDVDLLARSIRELSIHHDVFRFIYEKGTNGVYRQIYRKEIPDIRIDSIDITKLSGVKELEQLLNSWQESLDIDSGTLFHVGYLHGYADGSARIHFSFHHLMIDAVSWRIIKDDLQRIYRYMSANSGIDNWKSSSVLGAKGTSYRQWAEAITAYKQAYATPEEASYWELSVGNVPTYNSLLKSLSNGCLNRSRMTMGGSYTSKLLREVHTVYHTRVNDILLAALASALHRLTGSETNYVTMEGHGRESFSSRMDVSHTVGWFTCMYPVQLNAVTSDPGEQVVRIKEMLRLVPHNGIGYGALFGYIDNELPGISFNYLGQFDGKDEEWSFSTDFCGIPISPSNRESYVLSINCGIAGGEFHVMADGYLPAGVLSGWVADYVECLQEIIDSICVSPRSYLTLSDIDYLVSDACLKNIQVNREVDAVCLANSLQQGFIYHAIRQGDADDAYHTQVLWDYHAPIDAERLKQAWQFAQEKYPALRIRFSWEEELLQVIDKKGVLNWYYIDISGKSSDEQEVFIENSLHADRFESYNLEQGSLFRVYLLKRKEDFYTCIFSNHHAIIDGWSNPVLINYLHAVYVRLLQGELIGREIDTCYLTAQNYLKTNCSEQVSYWTEHLQQLESREDLSGLLLPDKKHIDLSGNKQIKLWKEKPLLLSGERYVQLKRFASACGVTIHAVLQYCWHKQLSVYTYSDHTVVGMVVSGRNLPIDGIEHSVGLYINTLPVIQDHSADREVVSLIAGLQNQINEANSRSNVNLARLQPGGTRLFNSLFAFENYPMPESGHTDQLSIAFREVREKQDYPLVVTVSDQPDGICFSLRYASELFDEYLMENLVDGIALLLDQITAKPGIRTSELSYLTPAQHEEIVRVWNRTAADSLSNRTVHEWFEKQVEKDPDRVAVISGTARLSYGELNERANRLASYLREQYAIRPDDRIVLYLDRNEQMLITILAVLKSGAAYVPIDPTMPDERVAYMVSDAGGKLLLTHKKYKDQFVRSTSGLAVEAVDEKGFVSRLDAYSSSNPCTDTRSGNLAYVIYTSGTTGIPKGVMVEHRHISHLVMHADLISVDETDNLLSLSGYQFDGSVYDFYFSLLNGASLTLSAKDVFTDFNQLNTLIEENKITNAFLTTALFNSVVDAELPGVRQLKYVLFGGESASVYHVNAFRKRYPDVKLINAYGPTETTVIATYVLTNVFDGEFVHTVPIGNPIPGTTVYVLDHFLRPLPIGATGELYIGGGRISRGYLNDPTQTAERFISNPFQSESERMTGYNAIIYRSGDLVRYCADGRLEFVGRNDFQVKIRGFRIELGEIETRLSQYPGICQCVVLAGIHPSGESYLAGYYVSPDPIRPEILSGYLGAHLPDYMIPSAFIYLKSLPLTINGKVDRRALPKAEFTIASFYTAPVTSVEEELCKLYGEVLHLPSSAIGVEDDFFGLGGNSILAIKLSGRLSRHFDRKIRIASLYTYRTIRGLASYLETSRVESVCIVSHPVDSPEEQLLSFAQERLWFIENYEGGSSAYNIPVVLQVDPSVDLAHLEMSIREVAHRHEVLHSLIKTTAGGIGYQEVMDDSAFPLSIHYRQPGSREELDACISLSVNKVFNLSVEYPIEITIYAYGGMHYLSLVIHHIAFDGWSADLFIRELSSFYRYFSLLSCDKPDEAAAYLLPEVKIQYKDYALWQRSYLQGDLLDIQSRYWQEELSGYEPLDLPTDHLRPAVVDYSGCNVHFSLDAAVSHQLRDLAKELNVSLYTLLLSGYYLLLSSMTNQEDLVIGTPVSGRHHEEIEGTIGFFVNTLVLRTRLDRQQPVSAFIQQTGQSVLRAQSYPDLPFEKLVDLLSLEKDPSRHPVFQVMFGLQSFGRLEDSGISGMFTAYEGASGSYQVAKFDLTTLLDDSGESIDGMFNYATSLFEEHTIHTYIQVYKHILSQLSDLCREEACLFDVSYLDAPAYQTVIYDWNRTRRLYPEYKTVVDLFEEQVRRTPDRPAVVFEGVCLTYRELNERANRLSVYLGEHCDIRPDTLIAVCMERSEHLLVAILSVLKAGAAYVPVGSDAPQERIRYMLEDGDIPLLLTSGSRFGYLDAMDLGVGLVSVDDPSLQLLLSTYPVVNVNRSVGPDNLAYVIYTSGTTGQPKGVMVAHGGLTNLAWYESEALGLGRDAGSLKNGLWYANSIFDAHVFELYPVITNGHCIHILEEEKRYSFDLLDEYITANRIDLAVIPPVLLEKNRTLNLSTLVLAGEVANREIMSAYYAKGVTVINAYGPAEATVCSMLHNFREGDSHTNIGRPIANVTAYVLGAGRRPVPPGAVGELYIGGAGLARGYVNHPELTEERFIKNPFQSDGDNSHSYNSRIYRSGDLVRYLPGGDLEFIGRADFQIKIRGYRIEPGEIETRLSRYLGMHQVVVLDRMHASGSKYLAAYYTSDNVFDEAELSGYLEQYLPDYMIPSAFVHLSVLPRTVNGKLDRSALPNPEYGQAVQYVAPQDEIAKVVCETYAEVLGMDKYAVGMDDDFFRLGGDSISSIQLVSKLRQRLNVHLTVKTIFSHHTVKALYAYILAQDDLSIGIRSEQGILSGTVGLLPIQEWFLNQVDQRVFPAYNHWNQAFVLHTPLLDKKLFELSLEKLVEYHDGFRLYFEKPETVGGSYTQFYREKLKNLPVSYLNISDLPPGSGIGEIYTEWQNRFDIFGEPLFHVGYVEGYPDNRARIHFAFHHLLVDGVSWRIIKNDLQILYQYLSTHGSGSQAGTSVSDILGDKGSSYRQWTQAISDYKRSDAPACSDELSFWDAVTAGLPESNALLSARCSDSWVETELVLDKSTTNSLLRKIHQVYGTQINDILLSALSAALTDFTGESTHFILLESHGREDVFPDLDINHTIGWFTSMYPVKLTSEKGQLCLTLTSVKDTLRKIPHNGIGYGALKGYTTGELPCITFNYLGQFNAADEAEQWSFSSEDPGLSIASENSNVGLLSINGGILDGQLRFGVSGYFRAEQLCALSGSIKKYLEQYVDLLSAVQRTYLTLSDTGFIVSGSRLDELQSEREIEGVFLANSLQQGFVYHAINQGDMDDAYRVQMSWDYHNRLDVDKLRQAWTLAQEKFPSLRLRFSWDEELLQIIDKKGTLHWHYRDISGRDAESQERFVKELLVEDHSEGYDLSSGSLFRVYVIRRSPEWYTCVLSNHHAILDGWSGPVLLDYIHRTYAGLLEGEEADVEPDRCYLHVQHYLQEHRRDDAAFWDARLSLLESQEDLTSLLKPGKRGIRLSAYTFIREQAQKNITVEGARYERLKKICSDNGFTVNAALQYGWHKQLSLYGHTDTTVVGMVVSGRNLPIEGIEQSVGLYINTLPVVLVHRERCTVLSLIKELQDHIHESNSRSNIHLSQLQSGGGRLFSSLFVFENYPMPGEDRSGELPLEFRGSKEKQDYPLVVTAFEQHGRLGFTLHYAAELFDEGLIGQLTDGISSLLDQLIARPEIRTDEWVYFTPEQYKKVVGGWNPSPADYVWEHTANEYFERQVERNPGRIALISGDVRLSYRELNERANRLASYLKENYALRPDDLIALYLDRSEYMLIAILAVWKSGAAYVPIEPMTPGERVVYMLSDTGSKALLTNQKYKDKLDGLKSGTAVEPIDEEGFISRLGAYPSSDLHAGTSSRSLAYIMYTSGTTGIPKGVMVEHHNINRLVVHADFVSVGETDHILSLSGYQFDGSTYDFYISLLNGASLTLPSREEMEDFNLLNALIEENEITNFFLTTALFNSVTDMELPALRRLKYVLFGGELVSVNHVNRFRELYPDVKLVHVYGPTETTTFATSFLINACAGTFVDSVPIGYPIAHTTAYVLDNNLSLLPVGVIGELYIGGYGVARGYLNDPVQTAERFVPDPFWEGGEESQRNGCSALLYKTGDLVRFLPSGAIEYVGRTDFQVKIRGFRIEPGEIEARLSAYPGIRKCVVCTGTHPSGDVYLVAYYVASDPIGPDDLSGYLSVYLPDYMIPSAFIHLEAFPLTINGKIDRKALPEVGFTAGSRYVAPDSAMEEQLCLLYGEIFKLSPEAISVEDDFFRLGGNSILAIKLSSKLSRHFNRKVHVSALFDHRTIRKLARYLEERNPESVHIAAHPVDNPEEQLLSFAQERLWFIESYEGGSSAYNVPMVLRISQSINQGHLEAAIREVVHRHEVLRSFIKTSSEGVGYQEVIDDFTTPLPVHLHHLQGEEELRTAIGVAANKIFDLANEYPIEVNIYTCGEARYLSMVIHHIAFDGWSADIFIRDLYRCYRYYSLLSSGSPEEDLTCQLPERSIQYKDYALWQRRYLQGDLLASLSDYWQKELSGYEPLELPTDKVRPALVDYSGREVCFTLDASVSRQLRDLAIELHVSLYTLLLSGYSIFLSAMSNQEDLIIGTPVAGRHYEEIEHTIGFFVNTLVLRVRLDRRKSLKAFIRETGQRVLQAQSCQDLPFEKLVELLSQEKDPSRHPVFQVMFGLQSFGRIEEAGMSEGFTSCRELLDDYRIAKFDLTTLLDDSGESISGMFNYATSLFEEHTIHTYIHTYKHILSQLSRLCREEACLSEVSYLDAPAYQTVIYDWNRTRRSYSEDKTVVDLFEDQVCRTPDYPAVVFGDISLTYRELNERVNRLSAYLLERYDIRPDTLIAVCLERSEHMLVAILSVLKTGAAYVPVGSDAPENRIRYMLEDGGITLLLTSGTGLERLEALSLGVDLVPVDDLLIQVVLSAYPVANVNCQAGPDNLAYVIYTSGTTGQPKGVMIEHKGLINLTLSESERFGLDGGERHHSFGNCLWYANYLFDAHALELYPAITGGHCIHILEEEKRYGFDLLDEYVTRNKIDLVAISPAVLDTGRLLNVSVLVLGGEVAPLELMNAYCIKGVKVINSYGPTEITVCSMSHCFRKGDSNRNIGRPIANTTAYVLDAGRRPVPPGAIGELYIGGAGVARGYIRNPGLTAERFLRNPFQSERDKLQHYNSRMYKTGDLVRYLPDGNIAFIGRNDFQIKIRGYRIEPGEIEGCLSRYPGIKQAVVLARDHPSGARYLVGYYVSDTFLSEEEIKNYLSGYLPEYMVPVAFVHLEALPLTSNGKLDRNALPEPELTDKDNYVASENDIEHLLCHVFAEVLQIDPSVLGVEDDFFKLGGNSILAVKLSYKINQQLHANLKVIDILHAKTVRAIGKRIINLGKRYTPVVELNDAIDQQNLFMIHPGMGGCEVYVSLALKLSSHFHCYGVDSYNLYHVEKMKELKQLAGYYLSAILETKKESGPYMLLGWSLGGQIAMEIAVQLEALGERDITVYLLDSWLLAGENIGVTLHGDPDSLLDRYNVPLENRDWVRSVSEIDTILSMQALSDTLRHTHVVLFKALGGNTAEIHGKYPLNNVDKWLSDSSRLTLIELQCGHEAILDNDQEIAEHMITFL